MHRLIKMKDATRNIESPYNGEIVNIATPINAWGY